MALRVPLHVSLVAILLCIAACEPASGPPLKKYNVASLFLTQQNGIYLAQGSPFTGVIYSTGRNSKDTVEVGRFTNGLEDGVWKKYYPGGVLASKRYYINGVKTGIFREWWPNSHLKTAYNFVNGDYEGSGREWNDKGILIVDMNYRAGHEDGLQRQFYPNGKIKANYRIINGQRYGLLGTKNCINVSDKVFAW